MITEKEFEGSIHNEYRLLRHVYSLVDHKKLDFRFSPSQRSTLEVLQYLGTIAGGLTEAVHSGGFDKYGEATARAAAITGENFLAMLDEEEKRVVGLLKKFDQKELDTQLDLFKHGSLRKAQWLIVVLQILSAYRTQLFLQIKASTGRTDIGTTDLWAGFTLPKKD